MTQRPLRVRVCPACSWWTPALMDGRVLPPQMAGGSIAPPLGIYNCPNCLNLLVDDVLATA